MVLLLPTWWHLAHIFSGFEKLWKLDFLNFDLDSYWKFTNIFFCRGTCTMLFLQATIWRICVFFPWTIQILAISNFIILCLNYCTVTFKYWFLVGKKWSKHKHYLKCMPPPPQLETLQRRHSKFDMASDHTDTFFNREAVRKFWYPYNTYQYCNRYLHMLVNHYIYPFSPSAMPKLFQIVNS